MHSPKTIQLMIQPNEFDRYLKLLGVQATKPSLNSLRAIVRAQTTKIPFENISKLYYWKTINLNASMDLTQYLNGVEQFHFGGTCYANAFHLHGLLAYLGYDVALCGADMNNPDVHIVNIVNVEGGEYMVDVGYAAPFLEPLPRDLPTDYVISFGSDKYVLMPKDEIGRSRLTFFREGFENHGYLVKPKPRSIDEFAQVIKDSFSPDATFMNAILLAKFGLDRSYVLHNMTYVESRGTATQKTHLKTRSHLIALIEEKFGIPEPISRVALNDLTLSKDPWS